MTAASPPQPPQDAPQGRADVLQAAAGGGVGGWLIRRASRRRPDFIIGGAARPYIRRWWLIPRNRLFNIYLHEILRDDDDRALHDHPWVNLSILLRGGYLEMTARPAGYQTREYRAGAARLRMPKLAHRLVLRRDAAGNSIPAWSLFITGPRVRVWGFWCERGWVDWRDFTNPADAGATVGRGCGEP